MHFKGFSSFPAALMQLGLIFFVNGQEENASVNSVVNSNNLFTEDIYQELLKTKILDNFVISPFSLSSVLAMLKAGASGETAIELSQGLRLQNVSDSSVHDGYADLLFKLQENKTDVVIETGNRIFIAERFEIKDAYLKLLKEKYYSAAEKTDFSQSEEAAEKINKFVATSTHDKITKIADPLFFSADTLAVLVNTIYFKGLWKVPFQSALTRPEKFYSLNGQISDVDMMRSDNVHLHKKVESLKSEVLLLPYKGDRFSLVIILPDENVNITDVEPLLTNSVLSQLPSELHERTVRVKLPKFKLESEVDFVATKILENLGMKKMFNARAEFDGITEEDVFVSKILQKAFIEISEEGTEAASSTFGDLPTKILPIQFEVNRPFIAYIFDEVAKMVIFVMRKVN